MNMNSMRGLLAVSLLVLIPNIASAYYAAHMGRWTSRDPFGEVVMRVGMEKAPYSGGSFVERDRIDPTAAYHDGMNLYQYVNDNPVAHTDSKGLDREFVVGGPLGFHGFLRTKCNGRCQELHFSIWGYERTECVNKGVVVDTTTSTQAQDQALCDHWDTLKCKPFVGNAAPYIPPLNTCYNACAWGQNWGVPYQPRPVDNGEGAFPGWAGP